MGDTRIMDHITTSLETLEKVYKMAKKNGVKEVSFEYVVGSCFPKIMSNIKEELRRQYTMGYAAGQEEVKINERKN